MHRYQIISAKTCCIIDKVLPQMSIRCLTNTSTLLTSGATAAEEKNGDISWENARPLSEVPRMKGLSVVANVILPWGKYYKKNLFQLNEMMREEYGDILLAKGVFGKPDTLLIYNPQDFEKVYRNEGIWPYRRDFEIFSHFRKSIRSDIYGKNAGLLVEQGEKWKELRGKVNPVMMQPRAAKQYVTPVEEVADEFIAKLLKLRDSNNELPDDASNEFNKWSLESIARIALDTRLGCLNDNVTPDSDSQKMIKAVDAFFELTYKLEILPSIWKYYKTSGYYKLIEALETMTNISLKRVDEAMTRLQNSQNQNSNREASVLEKLLKIDRNVAVIMAMDMLLAGVDTTSHTTTILMYFLAANPRAQNKLREEIMTILPENNSRLSADSFHHVPYLRACMKEAQRILPIAGGNIRKLPVDIVLSGYRIPKGTEVAMNHIMPSRDEKYYTKAKEYIPERWLTDQKADVCSAKNTNPFVHMPFGFGSRSCVGKRFADLEIETFISKLIRNNKIEWNYGELQYTSKLLTTPTSPLKFKITEL